MHLNLVFLSFLSLFISLPVTVCDTVKSNKPNLALVQANKSAEATGGTTGEAFCETSRLPGVRLVCEKAGAGWILPIAILLVVSSIGLCLCCACLICRKKQENESNGEAGGNAQEDVRERKEADVPSAPAPAPAMRRSIDNMRSLTAIHRSFDD